MTERLVGMLIFPRLTQLDMTGPYEVLARVPNTKVHLIAKTLDPVETDRGMKIRASPMRTVRNSTSSWCRAGQASRT
jgi:putative intracellular protease/amidase